MTNNHSLVDDVRLDARIEANRHILLHPSIRVPKDNDWHTYQSEFEQLKNLPVYMGHTTTPEAMEEAVKQYGTAVKLLAGIAGFHKDNPTQNSQYRDWLTEAGELARSLPRLPPIETHFMQYVLDGMLYARTLQIPLKQRSSVGRTHTKVDTLRLITSRKDFPLDELVA